MPAGRRRSAPKASAARPPGWTARSRRPIGKGSLGSVMRFHGVYGRLVSHPIHENRLPGDTLFKNPHRPSKAVGLARIMHGRWRVYRTWLDSRRIQSPNTNPTGIRRPPAMVDTTLSLPGLSPVRSKPLDIRFDGGVLSSDGGLLLFREVEERLRLADCLAG